jgi:hypothetical protein
VAFEQQQLTVANRRDGQGIGPETEASLGRLTMVHPRPQAVLDSANHRQREVGPQLRLGRCLCARFASVATRRGCEANRQRKMRESSLRCYQPPPLSFALAVALAAAVLVAAGLAEAAAEGFALAASGVALSPQATRKVRPRTIETIFIDASYPVRL